MTIWFFLWLLLSSALIGFLVWTFYILQKQKRAWKTYAARYKLRYKAGTMSDSPEVSGPIGDYTISLFPSEHMAADARTARKLSAVEIQLSSRMPVDSAVASGGLVPFTRTLNFREEMRPEHPAWSTAWIAASDNKAVLADYLTPARLETLIGLMKIPRAWVILVFKGETSLLRIDTVDPLDTPQAVDKLIKAMLEAAKVLELTDGEAERLKALKIKKTKKEVSLDLKEADTHSSGLQLEDDEDPS